jgi:hypothetical protein
MIKWLLHRKLAAFERETDYDASYMHEVLETDLEAFRRFGRATGLGEYRKDVPADVYTAAGLTSSIQADCGPCTQLGVGFALHAGVPAATIAAIVAGDSRRCRPTSRSACGSRAAVLARDASADEHREEIVRRFGARAVLTLGFAIMTAQLYPTLKYALRSRQGVHARRDRRSGRGAAAPRDGGGLTGDADDRLDDFEPHRRFLAGLAYRMLGSVAGRRGRDPGCIPALARRRSRRRSPSRVPISRASSRGSASIA